jgi:hypothetical protein
LTERVDALVAELLGAAANQELVRLCATSILSQCFTYHSSREIIIRLNTNLRLDTQDIERLAKHITEFSLAGLKAVASAAQDEIKRTEDI